MSQNVLELLVKAKDQTSKELNNVNKSIGATIKTLGSVGKVAAAAGTAVAASLYAITSSTAEAGDELAKMGRRLGISTKALSELDYAAQLSGTNINAVQTSLRRLAQSAQDAQDGLVESKREFERLGIEVTNADGSMKDIETLFYEVADALVKVQTQTERVGMAQALLGRGGMELLPMLEGGAEGLRKMAEEADSLGAVYDDLTGKQSEDMVDAQLRVKKAFEGVKIAIGSELMPVLTDWMNSMALSVVNMRDFIEEHKDAIKVVGKLALIIAGAGGLIVAINAFIALAPMVAVAWTTMMGPVGLVIGAIGGLILVLNELRDRNKVVSDEMDRQLAPSAEKLYEKLKDLRDTGKENTEEYNKLYKQWVGLSNEANRLKGHAKSLNEVFSDGIEAAGDMKEKTVDLGSFLGNAKDVVNAATGAVADLNTEIGKLVPGTIFTEDEIKAMDEAYERKKEMEDELAQYKLDTQEDVQDIQAEMEDKYNEEMRARTQETMDAIGTDMVETMRKSTNMTAFNIRMGIGKAVVEVGNIIQYQLSYGLGRAIVEGEKLGDVFKQVGKMILEYIVSALIEAIIKATILKALMSAFSWFLPFQSGGVVPGGEFVGPPVPGAQHGMLVPNVATGIPGRDRVPIMAEPGELILSKRITDYLREMLSIPARGMSFQTGGLVAATAGGIGTVINIENPTLLNEEMIDDLIDQLNDAVEHRGSRLTATEASVAHAVR